MSRKKSILHTTEEPQQKRLLVVYACKLCFQTHLVELGELKCRRCSKRKPTESPQEIAQSALDTLSALGYNIELGEVEDEDDEEDIEE